VGEGKVELNRVFWGDLSQSAGDLVSDSTAGGVLARQAEGMCDAGDMDVTGDDKAACVHRGPEAEVHPFFGWTNHPPEKQVLTLARSCAAGRWKQKGQSSSALYWSWMVLARVSPECLQQVPQGLPSVRSALSLAGPKCLLDRTVDMQYLAHGEEHCSEFLWLKPAISSCDSFGHVLATAWARHPLSQGRGELGA